MFLFGFALLLSGLDGCLLVGSGLSAFFLETLFLKFILLFGGMDGVLLLLGLLAAGSQFGLFRFCAGTRLAEKVDLDGGLDAHFVHLVGIGKTECATQIHPFAWSLEAAFGNCSVAHDLNVEILGGNEVVGGARHMGVYLADGQLAAQTFAHDGGTGLGDVDLEGGCGSNRTNLL